MTEQPTALPRGPWPRAPRGPLALLTLVSALLAWAVGACSGDALPASGCLEGEVLNEDGSCAPPAVAGAAGQGGQGGSPDGQGGAGAGGAGGEGGGPSGPPKVTVRGTLDGREGPRPGATLWVGGRPVVTDSDGKFEAPDVELPYQLVVRRELGGELTGQAGFSFYEGLRSTELSLNTDDDAPSSLYHEAHVTGTLAGTGAHPQPAGYHSELVALDDRGQRVGSGYISNYGADMSSAFDVKLSWPQAKGTSIAVKLYAIQYKDSSDDYIEQYTGYGLKQLTVNAYATVSNQTLTLADVDTKAVTFNITVPDPTFSVISASVSFRLAADGALLSNTRNGAVVKSPPFSLVVPQPAVDTRFSVTLRSGGAEVTQSVAPADANLSSLTFQPPLPLALQEPAAGGSITFGQKFSWSRIDGAVYEVSFQQKDYGGSWFSFYTSETSLALPDLSAFGAQFQKGEVYEWYVRSDTPVASIDAYLTGNAPITMTGSPARREVTLQ